MAVDNVRNDRNYSGTVNFVGPTNLPDNAIGNAQFSSGDPLGETKQEHRIHSAYQQDGTATSEVVPLYWAYANGVTLDVAIGSIVACIGAATVTVDIKKNGTTILSGVITLDSGNAAYTAEMGTVSVPAITSGDVLTATIVATAGGGTIATGLYIEVIVQEDAV